MDGQALSIGAMAINDNRTGSATTLPELLSQTPEAEELATVTRDGAYDTRLCDAPIAQHGAGAIIPPRRSDQYGKGNPPGNQACNKSLHTVKYSGRTL